jgi:hypothetical protein
MRRSGSSPVVPYTLRTSSFETELDRRITVRSWYCEAMDHKQSLESKSLAKTQLHAVHPGILSSFFGYFFLARGFSDPIVHYAQSKKRKAKCLYPYNPGGVLPA